MSLHEAVLERLVGVGAHGRFEEFPKRIQRRFREFRWSVRRQDTRWGDFLFAEHIRGAIHGKDTRRQTCMFVHGRTRVV